MGTNVSDNIQRTGITTGNSECVIYLDKRVLNLTIDEYITLKDTLLAWKDIIQTNITKVEDASNGLTTKAFSSCDHFYLNNIYADLLDKTIIAIETMEQVSYCANNLLLRCENFYEILEGLEEYCGDVFATVGFYSAMQGTAQAPLTTELYLEDTYYGQDGGAIGSTTESAIGLFSIISEENNTVLDYLSSLEIGEIDVSGECAAIQDDCDKKERLEILFSSFVKYVNGVNKLNTMASEKFGSICESPFMASYTRNYDYSGYKANIQSVSLERAHRAELHGLGITDEDIDATLSKGTVTLAEMVSINKSARGERIGINNNYFVKVIETDSNGVQTIRYGGDQGKFPTGDGLLHVLDNRLNENGCGVVAAVNQYLYLTGQYNISEEDYKKLANGFFLCEDMDLDSYSEGCASALRSFAVIGPTGALPVQMCNYVEGMCIKAENSVEVSSHWDLTQDYEKDYVNIKKQLSNDIPVIWAFHDNLNGIVLETGKDLGFVDEKDIEKLSIKKYDAATGTYIDTYTADSHYVTVTAIYENYDNNGELKRMVEISTWGEKAYVDYDEYVEYVSKHPGNRPFSSITNTTVH
ncbi:hypothetical protein SAMN02910275_01485 [Butyrivibrio sp. INlla18]|uniref:hypothetical protein n=1 Tax=Butyrivibrio sp. INlla18 TaxID=1520806 RepID=UPI0008910400|nr:hypothetical protein [Butyrivibrio sp. INlla18]SDA60293.1 hypothetical protein SAMN02910275_01485 [Butyrivibrio sp. INlla18]